MTEAFICDAICTCEEQISFAAADDARGHHHRIQLRTALARAIGEAQVRGEAARRRHGRQCQLHRSGGRCAMYIGVSQGIAPALERV